MEGYRSLDLEVMNMNEQELDRALESEAGVQLRNAVRAMPEEPVSMAWRSGLNQKILAQVETRRRRRLFAWIASPALGFGLAGALAFMFMANTSTPTQSPMVAKQSKLEESLVATFEENLRYTDITGVGLNPDEVVNRRSTPSSYEVFEAGYGSL